MCDGAVSLPLAALFLCARQPKESHRVAIRNFLLSQNGLEVKPAPKKPEFTVERLLGEAISSVDSISHQAPVPHNRRCYFSPLQDAGASQGKYVVTTIDEMS